MFYIFWARFVWWAFEVCSIFAEEVIPGGGGWIRRVAVGILSGEVSIRGGVGAIREGAGRIQEGEVMVRGGAGGIQGVKGGFGEVYCRG